MRFGGCPTRSIEKEPTLKSHKIEKILFTFESDSVILPDKELETIFKLNVVKSRAVPPVPLVSSVPPVSIYRGFIGDLIGAGNDRLNLRWRSKCTNNHTVCLGFRNMQ